MARSIVPAFFALAAAFTATRAAGGVGHALSSPGTRAWLDAAYDLLRAAVALAFALFTINRAEPRRRARDPLAYLACAAAMATVFVFATPARSTPNAVLIAGEAVSVIACVWLLASVLALGRCFGVLPEARGLVRRGPYRLVRHPVYLGEIAACAGLALASAAPISVAALAALIAAQSVRMRFEERALEAAFPDYVSYAARTPRLLPRPALFRRAPAAIGAERPAVHQPVADELRHLRHPARFPAPRGHRAGA